MSRPSTVVTRTVCLDPKTDDALIALADALGVSPETGLEDGIEKLIAAKVGNPKKAGLLKPLRGSENDPTPRNHH